MKTLHRERASVEGKEVDFFFLDDNDFKDLIQDRYQEFVKEHQQDQIAVALVGYPSFTSVVTTGVDFSLAMVREMYPVSKG